MNYVIKDQDGKILNKVHASLEFVKNYCSENGYKYEEIQTVPEKADESDPLATLAEAVAGLMYEADKKSIGG